jgi:hypothetical protein
LLDCFEIRERRLDRPFDRRTYARAGATGASGQRREAARSIASSGDSGTSAATSSLAIG